MGHPPQGPYGLPATGQPGPGDPHDFTPASHNRDVNFATCDIDPPSQNYIDVDDTFIMQVTGSDGRQVVCNLRILRPNGRIETCQFTAQAIGAGFSTFFGTRNEREGYLLSAEINAAGVGQGPGSVWFVQLSIRRGGVGSLNDYRVLIADYITQGNPASWPERPTRRSSDGAGIPISISVANPAAGADWTYTGITNQRLSITTVFAQLAAANAGTPRTVTLQITDGANILALIDANVTQAINTTIQYTGYPSSPFGGVGGTHSYWPLPEPLILPQTWKIGTVTNNINVADQWSLIRIGALLWVDFL